MTPITRPVSSLPPGIPFARYLKGLTFGPEFAAQYRDSPQVANAIEMRAKAAIAGLTSDAIPDLAQLGVYDLATAQLLGQHSAFEAARGKMRAVPFDIPVPRDLSTGSGGSWVAPGSPLPAISFMYDTVKLAPARLGSIFVVTDELLRHPQADGVLLQSALAAQGRAETTAFLDPSSTASGDAPASITNSGTSIPNTGTLAADLASMLAAIATEGSALCWLARPTTFAMIAASLGSASDLPRSLFGLPTIACPNAPIGQLVLADLAAIAYAVAPIDVERATSASIEMASDPTNAIAAGSPTAPTATELVSLYQANAVGFKVARFVNWRARDGAVAYLNLTGSPA